MNLYERREKKEENRVKELMQIEYNKIKIQNFNFL